MFMGAQDSQNTVLKKASGQDILWVLLCAQRPFDFPFTATDDPDGIK